jgi:tRNA threonylcarbamoyladenosine biosynthesis protein TsaB
MLFLAVDTAGTTGGVLLAKIADAEDPSGPVEVLGFHHLPAREFSTQLFVALADLFHGNPYRIADVAFLAAISGPGSFTGIRVGLSAVKALAEAASKPIVAVSRLAVMASAARDDSPDQAASVHAVLDAGRGQFYHGIYNACGWERVEESLQSLEGLADALTRRPGTLVASEMAVLTALQPFGPQQVSPVGVRQALPLMERSWRAGRITDALSLDANYLRASDAEILARLAVHAQQRLSRPPRYTHDTIQ